MYQIQLWSVADEQKLHTCEGYTGIVISIIFSPNSETLACSCADYAIRLWSVASGQMAHVCEGHNSRLNCIAFSPNGAILASSCLDQTRLWSVASGQVIHICHVSAWVAVFSPNSEMLACACDDGTIQLCSVASGQIIQNFEADITSASSITFSLNGEMFATISGNTVRLWSVGDWQNVQTLKLSISLTIYLFDRPIRFSPDCTMIATSSRSDDLESVQLWSVKSGEPLCSIRLPGIPIVLEWEAAMLGIGPTLWIGTEFEPSVQAWRVSRADNQGENNSINLSLMWASPSMGLQLKNACIKNVQGLDSEQKELLGQHGAIGEPSEGRVEELIE